MYLCILQENSWKTKSLFFCYTIITSQTVHVGNSFWESQAPRPTDADNQLSIRVRAGPRKHMLRLKGSISIRLLTSASKPQPHSQPQSNVLIQMEVASQTGLDSQGSSKLPTVLSYRCLCMCVLLQHLQPKHIFFQKKTDMTLEKIKTMWSNLCSIKLRSCWQHWVIYQRKKVTALKPVGTANILFLFCCQQENMVDNLAAEERYVYLQSWRRPKAEQNGEGISDLHSTWLKRRDDSSC